MRPILIGPLTLRWHRARLAFLRILGVVAPQEDVDLSSTHGLSDTRKSLPEDNGFPVNGQQSSNLIEASLLVEIRVVILCILPCIVFRIPLATICWTYASTGSRSWTPWKDRISSLTVVLVLPLMASLPLRSREPEVNPRLLG